MLDPALYWLMMGVMLLLPALVLPGFVLFFFAAGALAAALVVWFVPTTSIVAQLGFFIAASFVPLLLREVIQKRSLSSTPTMETEDVSMQLAVPGDRGVVCVTIAPPAEGWIKYSGASWRATADERISEGEIVAVVHQKGQVVHVATI
ncbi:MAG: NfeD family protein [Pseudomonadota bacterium]